MAAGRFRFGLLTRITLKDGEEVDLWSARDALVLKALAIVLAKVLVSCAIEVRHRKPGTKLDNRKDGRYAGRVRLAVVLDRSAESLCGFVESAVAPGSLIVTDDWSGYAGLGKRGYEHYAVAECGDPEVAEQYLPIIHLVFANLKTWLIGIHHGVSHQHLQGLVWSRNSAALSGRAWYGPKAPRRGTWCRGLRIYSDPSRMGPIRDQ